MFEFNREPIQAYNEVQFVEIERIKVPDNHRRADTKVVKEIVDSIEKVGLLNPITVRREGLRFILVAGLHRIEAYKQVGRSEIPATIKDYDQSEAQLAELYENLCRSNMTKLEQSEGLRRCKEIYEAKYPETKKGMAGAVGRYDPATARSSFAKDIAAKTGMSERDVRRKVRIAEGLSDELKKVIEGTPIADNLSEMAELLDYEPEYRLEMAQCIKAGNAKSVAEAHRTISKSQTIYGGGDGKFFKAIDTARKAFGAVTTDKKLMDKLVTFPADFKLRYREELLKLRKQFDELIELFSADTDKTAT